MDLQPKPVAVLHRLVILPQHILRRHRAHREATLEGVCRCRGGHQVGRASPARHPGQHLRGDPLVPTDRGLVQVHLQLECTSHAAVACLAEHRAQHPGRGLPQLRVLKHLGQILAGVGPLPGDHLLRGPQHRLVVHGAAHEVPQLHVLHHGVEERRVQRAVPEILPHQGQRLLCDHAGEVGREPALEVLPCLGAERLAQPVRQLALLVRTEGLGLGVRGDRSGAEPQRRVQRTHLVGVALEGDTVVEDRVVVPGLRGLRVRVHVVEFDRDLRQVNVLRERRLHGLAQLSHRDRTVPGVDDLRPVEVGAAERRLPPRPQVGNLHPIHEKLGALGEAPVQEPDRRLYPGCHDRAGHLVARELSERQVRVEVPGVGGQCLQRDPPLRGGGSQGIGARGALRRHGDRELLPRRDPCHGDRVTGRTRIEPLVRLTRHRHDVCTPRAEPLRRQDGALDLPLQLLGIVILHRLPEGTLMQLQRRLGEGALRVQEVQQVGVRRVPVPSHLLLAPLQLRHRQPLCLHGRGIHHVRSGRGIQQLLPQVLISPRIHAEHRHTVHGANRVLQVVDRRGRPGCLLRVLRCEAQNLVSQLHLLLLDECGVALPVDPQGVAEPLERLGAQRLSHPGLEACRIPEQPLRLLGVTGIDRLSRLRGQLLGTLRRLVLEDVLQVLAVCCPEVQDLRAAPTLQLLPQTLLDFGEVGLTQVRVHVADQTGDVRHVQHRLVDRTLVVTGAQGVPGGGGVRQQDVVHRALHGEQGAVLLAQGLEHREVRHLGLGGVLVERAVGVPLQQRGDALAGQELLGQPPRRVLLVHRGEQHRPDQRLRVHVRALPQLQQARHRQRLPVDRGAVGSHRVHVLAGQLVRVRLDVCLVHRDQRVPDALVRCRVAGDVGQRLERPGRQVRVRADALRVRLRVERPERAEHLLPHRVRTLGRQHLLGELERLLQLEQQLLVRIVGRLRMVLRRVQRTHQHVVRSRRHLLIGDLPDQVLRPLAQDQDRLPLLRPTATRGPPTSSLVGSELVHLLHPGRVRRHRGGPHPRVHVGHERVQVGRRLHLVDEVGQRQTPITRVLELEHQLVHPVVELVELADLVRLLLAVPSTLCRPLRDHQVAPVVHRCLLRRHRQHFRHPVRHAELAVHHLEEGIGIRVRHQVQHSTCEVRVPVEDRPHRLCGGRLPPQVGERLVDQRERILQRVLVHVAALADPPTRGAGQPLPATLRPVRLDVLLPQEHTAVAGLHHRLHHRTEGRDLVVRHVAPLVREVVLALTLTVRRVTPQPLAGDPPRLGAPRVVQPDELLHRQLRSQRGSSCPQQLPQRERPHHGHERLAAGTRLGQLVQSRPLGLQLRRYHLGVVVPVLVHRLPQQQLQHRDRLVAHPRPTIHHGDVRHRHVGDRCDAPRRGILLAHHALQPVDHLLGDQVTRTSGLQFRLGNTLGQRFVRLLQIPQRIRHRRIPGTHHIRHVRRVVQLLEHAEQRPALGLLRQGLPLCGRGLLHDCPRLAGLRDHPHQIRVHHLVRHRQIPRVPRLEPLQRPVVGVVQPEQLVARSRQRHLPELVPAQVHHVRQQLRAGVHVAQSQVLPQPLEDREQHQPIDLPHVPGLDRIDQVVHHLPRRDRRGLRVRRRQRPGQDVHLVLLVVAGADVHRRDIRIHDRPVALHQRSVRVHPLRLERAHQVPPRPQVGERRVIQDQLRLLHHLVTIEVSAERLQHRVRQLHHRIRPRPRQIGTDLRHEHLVRPGLVLRVPDEHQRHRAPAGVHQRRVLVVLGDTLVVHHLQGTVRIPHHPAELPAALRGVVLPVLPRLPLPVPQRLQHHIRLRDHLRDRVRRLTLLRQVRHLLLHPLLVRLQQAERLIEAGHHRVGPDVRRLHLRDHERPIGADTSPRRLLIRLRPHSVRQLLRLRPPRHEPGPLRVMHPVQRVLVQPRLRGGQLGRRLLLRRGHRVPHRPRQHLLRVSLRLRRPRPHRQHRTLVRLLVRGRLPPAIHPRQPSAHLHAGTHGEPGERRLPHLPPVDLVVMGQWVQHPLDCFLVPFAHTRHQGVDPLAVALGDPRRRTVVVVRRDHVALGNPRQPRRLHPRRDRRQLLRRRQHRQVHRRPLVVPPGPLRRPSRIQLHASAAHADGLPAQPQPQRRLVALEHPRDPLRRTQLHRIDRHRPNPRRCRDGIEVPLVVREHVVERTTGVRERLPTLCRHLRHLAQDGAAHLRRVGRAAHTGAELQRRVTEPGNHTQTRQQRRANVLTLLVRRVPLAPIVPDVPTRQPVVRAVQDVGHRLDELAGQCRPPQEPRRRTTPGAELLVRHLLLHPRARGLIQDLVLVQHRSRRAHDTTDNRPRPRPPGHRHTTSETSRRRQQLVRQPAALEISRLRLDSLVVVLLRQELRLPCRLLPGGLIHRTGHRIHVST